VVSEERATISVGRARPALSRPDADAVREILAGRAPEHARRQRRSARLTPRRAAFVAGATLLAIYVATLAPGVTFWDAGS
jgi:hypothetical protein